MDKKTKGCSDLISVKRVSTYLEDALLVLLKLVRHKGKVAVEFDRADGAGKVAVTRPNVCPEVLSVKNKSKFLVFSCKILQDTYLTSNCSPQPTTRH